MKRAEGDPTIARQDVEKVTMIINIIIIIKRHEDKIKDVLDDNDYISIVLETDRPDPAIERGEIKYVPEQM